MKVDHITNYVDAHDFLASIPDATLDSDASTASDITAVGIHGWNGLLLAVNLLRANDSDTAPVWTLQAADANSDSDFVAGAISTDTFQWTTSKSGSDNSELWLADINFSQAGITGSFLRPAFATLNAGDTVIASVVGYLYRGSQNLDHTGDNTITVV